MNPGDDHELRLLHAERRRLLAEQRRGKRVDWSDIRARIDALEVAGTALWAERRGLIFTLRVRSVHLRIEELRKLLAG